MKHPAFNPVNDVLVGMIPKVSDFDLLQKEGWYRVRIGKQTPINLQNGQARWIAFYFPAIFKDRKYQIQFKAEIKQIEEVGFFDLFPQEFKNHPKASRRYYQLKINKLIELPEPIVSLRGRRNAFISTTAEKFNNATEINDLYNESPLEDILWQAFKAKEIPAERQYWLEAKGHHFFLDFAVFCDNKNRLDIECDGITYHSSLERQQYDRKRNNAISLEKWNFLRYDTNDIEQQLPRVMDEICEKIDQLGGLQSANKSESARYINKGKFGQLRMFD